MALKQRFLHKRNEGRLCVSSVEDDLLGKGISYLCFQAPWSEGKCKARPFAATDLHKVSCVIKGSGQLDAEERDFGLNKSGLSVGPKLASGVTLSCLTWGSAWVGGLQGNRTNTSTSR